MKQPYIVGVAGGSASGKTTFSKQLAEKLTDRKLLVMHMDHYFKSDDIRPKAAAPITGRVYLDDNHPDSFELPRFKEELKAAMESGEYEIILIEGLLTLWDKEICGMLDLRLFIECRADERIVRRLKRNMQWGLTFDEIADVYLDMVRYRHDEYVEPSKWRADLILNGSNPSEIALEMVVRQITANMQ